MTARTIVTSHPDVACDVCGRRLLRGEQPDVFLGGGQRRLVCELCTTRATHEGWRRETEEHAGRPRAERPARGSSLLRRLRQLREPALPARAERQPRELDADAYAEHGAPAESASEQRADAAWTNIDAEWAAAGEEWVLPGEATTVAPDDVASADGTPSVAGHARAHAGIARALAIFNSGEYPRRLAGVARSLGAPSVRVWLPGEHAAIMVAWELCWYRYEIDPQDEPRGAWLAAEGMELDELDEQDRIANAAIDEHGKVALLAS